MENKGILKAFLPIVVVFVVSGLFALLGRPLLSDWNADYRVLLVGNILLFLATVVSFYMYNSALRNNNMHVFIRVMYGSVLVKMFVCLLAVLFYALFAGATVNRNGIIGCFVLYILYTFFEVKILTKLSGSVNKKS